MVSFLIEMTSAHHFVVGMLIAIGFGIGFAIGFAICSFNLFDYIQPIQPIHRFDHPGVVQEQTGAGSCPNSRKYL